MEDLREVGKKVIEAIKNRKSSDAGDLALGIGQIIDELRKENESAKLGHLEGLFRELVYGEEYEFREKRPETETIGNPYGIMSGMVNVQPMVSGWLLPQAPQSPPIVTTGVQVPPTPPSNVANPPHVTTGMPPQSLLPVPPNTGLNDPLLTNPCGEEPLDDEEEEPPKPFKKRWWMSVPKETEETEDE